MAEAVGAISARLKARKSAFKTLGLARVHPVRGDARTATDEFGRLSLSAGD